MTIVCPSGDRSSDIHVPSDTSKDTVRVVASGSESALGTVSFVLSRPVSAGNARSTCGGAGREPGWDRAGTTAARTVAVRTLRIPEAPGRGTTAGLKTDCVEKRRQEKKPSLYAFAVLLSSTTTPTTTIVAKLNHCIAYDRCGPLSSVGGGQRRSPRGC